MRVLSVASEVYPIVKTGGLADVVGALPAALAREGVEVQTLVPGYPAVIDALESATTILPLDDVFGERGRVLAGRGGGLDLLVLDAPHLYDRPGGPYLGLDGRDWPDNAFRFAALSRVAAQIALGAVAFVPDIVHAHDWQAGLSAAYLRFAPDRGPGSVMTVHNLAFQGLFSPTLLGPLGLPPQAYAVDGIEYYGNLSFLKAGLQFADRITTVSPTYAVEIATPRDGMGFDGLLRTRADRFSGILNGIDDAVWDPARDRFIAATYDLSTIAKRTANTAALRKRFALTDDPQALLVGIISRLSAQKGLDLLLQALPRLISRGVQFVVLGAGDTELEAAFVAAVATYPGRIGAYIGYDETAAHLLQAGSDVILVPSRFEPCGLTQLCALRYGAVPVVARVGGLADTVIDANEMALAAQVATGIQFTSASVEALEDAVLRAAKLFAAPDTWHVLQRNAMSTDVSWSRSGRAYARLYREILDAQRTASIR